MKSSTWPSGRWSLSPAIEENRRELELTKHVSVLRLNPLALLELRETGTCEINLPEELFNLDYPGHYFRRVKSVSITIPCIVWPYNTVNCTLRLLNNSIRTNTTGISYAHNQEDGIDDNRFVENNIPFTSIATSSAQNDSGVFELNFRDELYLPFEGAGVISKWKLELNGKYKVEGKFYNYAQFDFNTISDVILHIRYTAREDAGKFKQNAIKNLHDFLQNGTSKNELFTLVLSMKHDFLAEFYKLLHPSDDPQHMEFTITKNHLPYWLSVQTLKISEDNHHQVFIRPKEGKSLLLTDAVWINDSTDPVSFNSKLGTLRIGDITGVSGNLTKILWSIGSNNNSLKPDEVDDIMILVKYMVQLH